MRIIRIQVILVYLLFRTFLSAQPHSITLDSCYFLAIKNYPLSKQFAWNEDMRSLTLANINKGWLPQVNAIAQATYQSAVTSIPIKLPNIDIPSPGKDQYKIYLDGNQMIYDGGQINVQKRIKSAEIDIENEKNNVVIFQIKDKINQIYFGILMIDEQQIGLQSTKSDLQATLRKVEGAIRNGTMLQSNGDNVRAEILRLDQRSAELSGNRNGLLNMLSWLTATDIDSNTVLLIPNKIQFFKTINRPEISVLDAGNNLLDLQAEMIKSRNLPRLGIFIQAGLGKPALNLLSNEFDPYFLGGIKVQVPLTAWYNNRNDHQLVRINKQGIDLQKEQFLYNIQLQQKQQVAEADKLNQLILYDDQIIATREKSMKAAQSQLDNGVITISDLINQSNKIEEARNNKALHEMQLLMNYYNQKFLTGN